MTIANNSKDDRPEGNPDANRIGEFDFLNHHEYNLGNP